MDGGTAMKGIFVRVYPQGVLHKVCWQGQTAMVPTDTGAPDRVRAAVASALNMSAVVILSREPIGETGEKLRVM